MKIWRKFKYVSLPALAVLAVLAFSACSGSPKEIPPHKVVPDSYEHELLSDFESITVKIIPDEEFQKYKAMVNDPNYDPYNDIILPLREIVFNTETLSDNSKAGVQRTELLRIYAKAVWDLVQGKSGGLWRFWRHDSNRLANEVLAHFEKVMTFGCKKPEMRYGCRLVDVFARVATSWDIWAYIIDNDPAQDIAKTKARLRIGWKIKNFRENSRIELAYLKYARQIEAALEKNPSNEDEDEHFTFIQRILEYSDGLVGHPEYDSYIRSTLNAPLDQHVKNNKNRLRLIILNKEAQRGLFKESWFQESLTRYYANNPDGYEARLKSTLKITPEILKNFGVTVVDPAKNPGFYLIENVYNGVWEGNTASLLWQYSGISKEDMHSLIENYVKAMVLTVVTDSNKYMGDIFKNRVSEEDGKECSTKSQDNLKRDKGSDCVIFKSSEVIKLAYEKSEALRDNWSKLYSRVTLVYGLAKLIFGETSKELASLKIDQDSLNEASQHLVSYPHMMLMTYEMVIHKFKLERWYSTIDYNLLLEAFFQGAFDSSWFDYTSNGRVKGFSPTELLYSFHFALKTQAFDAFGIGQDTFVQTVSTQFLRGSLQRVRDVYRIWSEPLDSFRSDYNTFLHMCKVEKQYDEMKRLSPDTVAIDFHRDYNISVPIQTIGLYIIPASYAASLVYMPNNIILASQPDIRPIQPFDALWKMQGSPLYSGLQMYSNLHDQSIEYYRMNFSERIRYIEDLLQIYRQFLWKTYAGSSVFPVDQLIEQKMSKAGAPLEEAQHEYRRFYTRVFSYIREMMLPCVIYMAGVELNLQKSLIFKQMEFYRQIYRDYKKLEAIASSLPPEEAKDLAQSKDPRVVAILKKYKVKGMEKYGYFGKDTFNLDKKEYLAYHLDARLRYGTFFKERLDTDKASIPALNNAIELSIPVEGFKDQFIRGFEKSSISLNLNVANEEDFALRAVRSTMVQRDGSADDYFAGFNRWIESWIQALEKDYMGGVINGLYKAGEVEIYDPRQSECLAAQPPTGCRVMKTKLSDQEFRDSLFGVYNLMSGDIKDQEFLKLLDINYRGSELVYGNKITGGYTYRMGASYLLRNDTEEPLGFFDYSYYVVSKERLGWHRRIPWEPPPDGSLGGPRMLDAKLTPLNEGQQYYEARSAEPFLLFGMDSDVSDYLFKAYKARVNLEFSGPKRVRNMALESETIDKENLFEREYFIPNNRGPSVKSFYLDQALVQEQEAVENNFHKATNYIFLNKDQQ